MSPSNTKKLQTTLIFFYDGDDLFQFTYADLVFFGKERHYIFIGILKIMLYRFMHKGLFICFLAYNRIVLMGLAKSIVADETFFFHVSNNR